MTSTSFHDVADDDALNISLPSNRKAPSINLAAGFFFAEVDQRCIHVAQPNSMNNLFID